MTWEDINFTSTPHSARRAYLKFMDNISWPPIAPSMTWEGCTIYLTNQELGNGTLVWEYSISQRCWKKVWPSSLHPQRPQRSFKLLNYHLIKTSLTPPLVGDILQQIIVSKNKVTSTHKATLVANSFVESMVGLTDLFTWRDGRPFFIRIPHIWGVSWQLSFWMFTRVCLDGNNR